MTATPQHLTNRPAPDGSTPPLNDSGVLSSHSATTGFAGSVGSIRERRPGVWEIRIAVGRDPVTGTPRQRSFTVHGDATDADRYRRHLLDELAGARLPAARHLHTGELLSAWLDADHDWKPSTRVGYRSVVGFLLTDPLATSHAAALSPAAVRAALSRWEADGAGTAVTGGRVRVLRAALSWAWAERILPSHPLRGLRGPARPAPRRPLPDHAVGRLLATAELRLLEAHANHTTSRDDRLLHRAEQDLLLVRLAADTGARRGELAALRFEDLHHRQLHLQRADSAGHVTTPKSGHGRVLTLGTHAADLWHQLADTWTDRWADPPLGPWLFTADTGHHHRLRADNLGARFTALRDAAGVPDATLHRFRHAVATHLVRQGKILDAQARLGHADAATTLREYSYAQPGTDTAIADQIDHHLDTCRDWDDPAPG